MSRRILFICLTSILVISFPISFAWAKKERASKKTMQGSADGQKNKPAPKKGKKITPEQERNMWEKRKRQMDPFQFKALVEFWNQYHAQFKELPDDIFLKTTTTLEQDSQITLLQEELDKLQKEAVADLKENPDRAERIATLQQKLTQQGAATLTTGVGKTISLLQEELDILQKEATENPQANPERTERIETLKHKLAVSSATALADMPPTDQGKLTQANSLINKTKRLEELTPAQRSRVSVLADIVNSLNTTFKEQGSFDKDQYERLIAILSELKAMLHALKQDEKPTINYVDRIALLETHLERLKQAYVHNGTLDKDQLGKTISLVGSEIEIWKNGNIHDIEQMFQKGLLFKVQIGAYRKRDLSKIGASQAEGDLLDQERAGDINQYTLRTFRNYWDADRFKKEMRAMGVRDAYIIILKDGNRVPIKEVLEIIRKQKSESR